MMTKLKKFVSVLKPKKFNEGTEHWLNQRISSILLIPFTVLFIYNFSQNIGLDYEKNIIFYKSPIRAALTFLFISVTLLHFKQGAQVVIEDYIHDHVINRVFLKINNTFFWGINFILLCAFVSIVL